MNLFALSGLSVGISCTLLTAIATYFGRTKLHRLLLSFNLFVAVWGFGCYFAGIAHGSAEAILAWKITHIGGLLIGPSFFHLVSHFCEKPRKKIIITAYIIAISILIVDFSTDLVIFETRYVFGLYYHTANPYYIFATVFYLGCVGLSYHCLMVFLRSAHGLKRIQTLFSQP